MWRTIRDALLPRSQVVIRIRKKKKQHKRFLYLFFKIHHVPPPREQVLTTFPKLQVHGCPDGHESSKRNTEAIVKEHSRIK